MITDPKYRQKVKQDENNYLESINEDNPKSYFLAKGIATAREIKEEGIL